MDRNEILIQLQNILRDILEDDEIIIAENTSANDIPGWDSLAHINMIDTVEETFNVKFSMGEVVLLSNVAGLIDLIQKKLSEQ